MNCRETEKYQWSPNRTPHLHHIGQLSQVLTAFLEEMLLWYRSILFERQIVVIKIFGFLILKRNVLHYLMLLNKGIA